MNHFELFNLPVELDIDLAVLKNEFLKLQQQYHPDKAEDKDQALIKSSEINQAFKVLSQVDSGFDCSLNVCPDCDGLSWKYRVILNESLVITIDRINVNASNCGVS